MIKAEAKFIRTSPRKLRLVADLVRNMSLAEAISTLTHLRKRSVTPLLKTLKQATANAVNNLNLSKDSLQIQSIEVNEGATYKRWNPVSRGRAHSILKRTSHIKVLLKSNNSEKGDTLTGDARESRVGTAKPEGVTLSEKTSTPTPGVIKGKK
ncbi:MAG: 50S ribosomal protein L22 [Candidatus Beckwithbacteria bacterium]|nr:50S ribosomal protein L22 [Patescibacteria group bacterium]